MLLTVLIAAFLLPIGEWVENVHIAENSPPLIQEHLPYQGITLGITIIFLILLRLLIKNNYIAALCGTIKCYTAEHRQEAPSIAEKKDIRKKI